ncbi:MAG: phosphatidate cytidylyltransferase [Candidatus Marinimicrobia bacterium]|nr:phosphatidate cytidylyltransferase [Candidatus Neomarinimicrobiota bacterium]
MALSELRTHEIVRKAIHISSSAIPLLYWFIFTRDVMLRGVLILAFGFLLAEYLRLHFSQIRKIFMLIFGSAIRNHEHEKLTGATYVFTGAVLSIFLFSKEVAVTSLLILSVSDTLAALIGIPFGKHKFLSKSFEGSTAFFLSTLIILSIFIPQQVLLNVIISIALTLLEASPIRIDDNFSIPLLAGCLLSLTSLL